MARTSLDLAAWHVSIHHLRRQLDWTRRDVSRANQQSEAWFEGLSPTDRARPEVWAAKSEMDQLLAQTHDTLTDLTTTLDNAGGELPLESEYPGSCSCLGGFSCAMEAAEPLRDQRGTQGWPIQSVYRVWRSFRVRAGILQRCRLALAVSSTAVLGIDAEMTEHNKQKKTNSGPPPSYAPCGPAELGELPSPFVHFPGRVGKAQEQVDAWHTQWVTWYDSLPLEMQVRSDIVAVMFEMNQLVTDTIQSYSYLSDAFIAALRSGRGTQIHLHSFGQQWQAFGRAVTQRERERNKCLSRASRGVSAGTYYTVAGMAADKEQAKAQRKHEKRILKLQLKKTQKQHKKAKTTPQQTLTAHETETKEDAETTQPEQQEEEEPANEELSPRR